MDKPKNPIQLPQIGSDRAAWLDDRSGPQRKFLTIAKDDDAEMINQISRPCGLCSTEDIIGAGARFRPLGARNSGWFDYRRSMPAAARPACNGWSWTPSGISDPDCGIDGVRDKSLAAEKPIDDADFKSTASPAASGCNFMGQEFGVYEASRAELHKWRHLTGIMQGSIPPRACGSTTP